MEYIINTTFLGDDISYDLIEGKFDFQKDNNPITLVDSFQSLVKQENILKKHNDFMCITISTTDACNLNCLYCFEKHGKTLLKKEYIPDICKLIAEYKKNQPHVTRLVVVWFGGEPLLNLNFIIEASRAIQKICNELSLDYSGRIITNGVKLDKLIPHIKELCITDIQITLDGTKGYHDSRRIGADGLGTFDTIISNIKNINSEVDLIIRMNVDKNNLSECIKLYDYIVQLPMNKCVTTFFQPMLVENYGGESTCYDGMILDDEELNEEYLDLLEYTNTLENPKYIRAFCNVDFSGSVVIRTDGSLCKCWAEVAGNYGSHMFVNSKTNIILPFLNQSKHLYKRKSCHTCIIYPTCLGGCQYKNYTAKECDIKRKIVLSTIIRLFIEEKTKKDIFYKILNNELNWLRSIGCKIRYKNEGIKIIRSDLPITDFNFHIGIDCDEKCIRLSQKMKNFTCYDKYLLKQGYEKDSGYDINYYFYNNEEIYTDDIYVLEEKEFDSWANDGFSRTSNRNIKFYFIRYGKDIIGKLSVVITDIIGIYDFEIYENYRGVGHGSNVLSYLAKLTRKDLFIQTWSENYVAKHCYEKAGFTKVELLYRYIQTE